MDISFTIHTQDKIPAAACAVKSLCLTKPAIYQDHLEHKLTCICNEQNIKMKFAFLTGTFNEDTDVKILLEQIRLKY